MGVDRGVHQGTDTRDELVLRTPVIAANHFINCGGYQKLSAVDTMQGPCPERMLLLLRRDNRVDCASLASHSAGASGPSAIGTHVSEDALRSEGHSGLSPSAHLLQHMAIPERLKLPTFGLEHRTGSRTR